MDHKELNRIILRGNIERESQMGRGVRPHEVEHAVDVAETLWTANKGNGQATDEAIALIRDGLA